MNHSAKRVAESVFDVAGVPTIQYDTQIIRQSYDIMITLLTQNQNQNHVH